ncbi:MAG: hypothetical protein E3J72_22685 [Planctomycetota bacterium]|nr:MAG: hypothetical protein E3J72_22685 [Planctomycetota bacterium]
MPRRYPAAIIPAIILCVILTGLLSSGGCSRKKKTPLVSIIQTRGLLPRENPFIVFVYISIT